MPVRVVWISSLAWSSCVYELINKPFPKHRAEKPFKCTVELGQTHDSWDTPTCWVELSHATPSRNPCWVKLFTDYWIHWRGFAVLPNPCRYQDFDRSMSPHSLASRDAPRRCARWASQLNKLNNAQQGFRSKTWWRVWKFLVLSCCWSNFRSSDDQNVQFWVLELAENLVSKLASFSDFGLSSGASLVVFLIGEVSNRKFNHWLSYNSDLSKLGKKRTASALN